MIATDHDQTTGLTGLVGRVACLALKGIQTRIELLAVEWQEERLRIMDLLLCAIGLVLLATMGVLFLTLTIILLFPANVRLYVTAGFALFYLLSATAVALALKNLLRREPFAESLDQVRKDRLWLESLK